MSNTLAIAAVTEALRVVIDNAIRVEVEVEVEPTSTSALPPEVIPSATIETTLRPLDKARDVASNSNQVNIFLYQTAVNVAWRNQGFPPRGAAATATPPALALNLFYLLTAYSEDAKDLISQHLLARAMLALHDHPVLGPGDLSGLIGASKLQDQVERVRISPHELTPDEMSKLWTSFHTPYRLSAGYEASVVLIGTTRPRPAALPVLTPMVYASPLVRPRIESVSPQVATSGQTLSIYGSGLKGAGVTVRFRGWVLDVQIAPGASSPAALSGFVDVTASTPLSGPTGSSGISVVLPARLLAGVVTVQVILEAMLGDPATPHPGAGLTSNLVAFVVAPTILPAPPLPPPPPPTPSVARDATLTLSVAPAVARHQSPLLMLASVSDGASATIPAVPLPADRPTDSSLSFRVPAAMKPGTYLMRLQVDGVESQLTVANDKYAGPEVVIS